MEVVVNGRNSEISDRFREHVLDKLQRVDKYDARQRIQRIEVMVTHEKTRDPEKAARVELTLRSAGPVVRAEAASTDQHSALDAVVDKLESRLRRSNDRHRVHHGQRGNAKLARALADIEVSPLEEPAPPAEPDAAPSLIESEGDCPVVVREKTHVGRPMTLDQALYEMELVGHDFYLFVEKDSMRPSVVYLRHAYDYGVIHLDVQE